MTANGGDSTPHASPPISCYRRPRWEPAGSVDGRHPPRARRSPPRPADEAHARGEPASLGSALRRSWPAWLVAYSLNGFLVYLAALDAVWMLRPRTALTAMYYGLLCVALLATAWRRRSVAIARALPRQRTVVAFVSAVAKRSRSGSVLNTALLSDGTFALRLAGLLVPGPLSPTALVAGTLRRSDVPEVARGLTASSHSGSW